MEHDWWKVSDRNRCWTRCMYCTLVHSRTLPHEAAWSHGRTQCGDDHLGAGHRIWHWCWFLPRQVRMEMDGRSGFRTSRTSNPLLVLFAGKSCVFLSGPLLLLWSSDARMMSCSALPSHAAPIARILLRRGDYEGARNIMRKIYAHARTEDVDLKVKVLQAAVQQSVDITNSTTFFERLRSMLSNGINRRALIVGCGMQAYQQLCGFNTLMYYSATLFKQIGFNQPTAVGLIVSGTNFIFTLVALATIDKIGRRRIMIWSAPGMVVGLTVGSISFYYLTKKTGHTLVDGSHYSTTWSALVLLSMILFVASYATGLGNVPWQQGEMFGLEVRGIGTSLSTATNWAGNLLIGSTYLSLMATITPAGAFGFYAGLCLLGWIFVLFCFPETAGLSLEEVRMIFRNGFGIKESGRLRKLKRDMKRREMGKH
ncbi:hypothetical protein AX17_007159 [Amanita inopinata Kibby_2008]|nr:hypothetical protein AX17_007159 [Amanita inopinata Kibby_2008]